MKYLVVASGGPGFSSAEEALEVLEKTILPSFAALNKLEAEKKILAGGLPVGDRAFVFILEARSNEEVDQLLRDIPMWGSLDWEVTPLLSFSARAAEERKAIKAIKRAMR
jgi:muconolactone delta-isomerase